MKIAIRADAGLHMGAGHVMRCLTLAEALRDAGHDVLFLCRAHPGHRGDYLKARGFAVALLGEGVAGFPMPDRAASPPHAAWLGTDWESDAEASLQALGGPVDLLITDHYALDARYEKRLRNACRHSLVIDDLGDRDHDCDLLLDQGYGRLPSDYDGRLPDHCRMLAGTAYALLRPEFAAHRVRALERRKTYDRPRHLLLAMGGIDPDNLTGRVIEAVQSAALDRLTVVLGGAAPHIDVVRTCLKTVPYESRLLVDCDHMAKVMQEADLAIGTVGATSWERCCLGLPALGIVAADNQAGAAKALAEAGAIHGPVMAADIRDSVIEDFLTLPPQRYAAMAAAAAAVCDGAGVARVMAAIRELVP